MQVDSLKATLPARQAREGMSRLILALALAVLACAASGCASGLTSISRPYTKDLEEGRQVGEKPQSYRYELRKLPPLHAYQLFRTPLCPELQEMKRISRKQPRGFVLALAEMPLYGLGLLDWLYAKSISERSEQVLDTWLEPTSRLVPCGEEEAAPRQTVVLQSPRGIKEPRITVRTDEEGKLQLRSLFEEHFRFGLINIFVFCDGDLKYLRSLYL